MSTLINENSGRFYCEEKFYKRPSRKVFYVKSYYLEDTCLFSNGDFIVNPRNYNINFSELTEKKEIISEAEIQWIVYNYNKIILELLKEESEELNKIKRRVDKSKRQTKTVNSNSYKKLPDKIKLKHLELNKFKN